MKIARVKMNEIKFAGVLDDVFYQYDFAGDGILAPLVFTKRPPAGCNELGACNRVSTAKQSHFVSCANQFFSEIRNDSLRPSIMFWRHAFMKRCYLRNSHLMIPLFSQGELSAVARNGFSVCKKPRAFTN